MLIMAEVSSEMGAELRAAALANHTSVAVEVGRRLERLERLEAEVSVVRQEEAAFWLDWHKRVRDAAQGESLYSGPPNPLEMFRNTGKRSDKAGFKPLRPDSEQPNYLRKGADGS